MRRLIFSLLVGCMVLSLQAQNFSVFETNSGTLNLFKVQPSTTSTTILKIDMSPSKPLNMEVFKVQTSTPIYFPVIERLRIPQSCPTYKVPYYIENKARGIVKTYKYD